MAEEKNEGEYECEACHNVYLKGWTDGEAAAEAEKTWGDVLGDDAALVCDDCYNAMTAWKSPETAIREKKLREITQ